MGSDDSPNPTIRLASDGPYLVEGLASLTRSGGDAIPLEGRSALCRCGGSARKPFCDGTHRSNGFSGTRSADPSAERRADFRGSQITVHDTRSICSHAGACTAGLPSVWRLKQEPWIDPDGAAPDAIVDVVRRCPSGALSATTAAGLQQDQERPAAVHVSKNGPYVVEGGIELVGVDLAVGASREHYTLCRCGASKNKPFCDGSHWAAKFNDPDK